MNAVPLALKRAIGVGIGLFILFIGFANGGFVVRTPPATAPVTFHLPTTAAEFVFWIGLVLTIVLWVLQDPGGARHQHPRDDGRRARSPASTKIPTTSSLTP